MYVCMYRYVCMYVCMYVCVCVCACFCVFILKLFLIIIISLSTLGITTVLDFNEDSNVKMGILSA